MPLLAQIHSLVRNLFRPSSVERDLDAELRACRDLIAHEKMRAGESAAEASRAANVEFGGIEQIKQEVRDVRTGSLVESFLQDLRYAFRGIARSPGFASIIVASLAIGIGGNAAMFSLINGILLRPLPYADPGRLVHPTGFYPKGATVALQTMGRSMDIASYSNETEFNLTGQGEALRLAGSTMSANIFELLGVHAQIGRVFQSGEDQPGADRIAVISDALWRQRFGADPAVLGRHVTIDGVDREIVGVMPASFGFPSPNASLWMPFHLNPSDPLDYWDSRFNPLVGRLRPGATVEQARQELQGLIKAILPMFPYTMARTWNNDATVTPLQEDQVGSFRGKLLVLAFAAGLVLLVAAANVASLLLSRATARGKEMAIRVSLGAGRSRIIRQLLTESVVLSLIGAIGGFLLADFAVKAVRSSSTLGVPRLSEISIDWPVLLFMGAIAVFTGVAAGLAPAFSASRVDLALAIKTGGQRASGGSAIRLRNWIVAGEIALSVVLTIGAGLLVKNLWQLMQTELGFRPERVLTVKVTPNRSVCANRTSCIALYEDVVRRARAIGGISDVVAVNTLPLSGEAPLIPVEMEGQPLHPGETLAPLLWAGAITPEYFQFMRIPLLAGRAFTQADSERSSPVMIVSASTARRYWPGENPIGKHVRVVWDKDWREVVGVVADVRQHDLAANSLSFISGAAYMPYSQAVDATHEIPYTLNLLLRGSAEPVNVAAEVHALVGTVNPNVPVGGIRPLAEVVSASVAQPRSTMWLFVAFAGTALVLAMVGAYGIVSHTASQRTYELGVRVALGASRVSIFRMVIRDSLRLTVTGVAIGVAVSLVAGSLFTRFLYRVSATDPLTICVVVVLLLMSAVAAGCGPARRAARVDPLTALRVD